MDYAYFQAGQSWTFFTFFRKWAFDVFSITSLGRLARRKVIQLVRKNVFYLARKNVFHLARKNVIRIRRPPNILDI